MASFRLGLPPSRLSRIIAANLSAKRRGRNLSPVAIPRTAPGPAGASAASISNPRLASHRRGPGRTPVCLPWGSIHMGDSPGHRNGLAIAALVSLWNGLGCMTVHFWDTFSGERGPTQLTEGCCARMASSRRVARFGAGASNTTSISARGEGRNPNPEGRKKPEIRNPKPPLLLRYSRPCRAEEWSGFRPSDSARPSDFGLRDSWASGGSVQLHPVRGGQQVLL